MREFSKRGDNIEEKRYLRIFFEGFESFSKLKYLLKAQKFIEVFGIAKK